MLRVGIIGAGVTALCCFTPLLAWLLPAVGLGGIVSVIYTDAVLLPLLAGFLFLAGFGLWRRRRARR